MEGVSEWCKRKPCRGETRVWGLFLLGDSVGKEGEEKKIVVVKGFVGTTEWSSKERKRRVEFLLFSCKSLYSFWLLEGGFVFWGGNVCPKRKGCRIFFWLV